jgi:RNA polymerase sigma-70 factor (ECF subfamily)
MSLEWWRNRKERVAPQSQSHSRDEDLVVSATYGDLNAFNELVRRFRYAVTMVALDILKSRETAEDVAQESLVTAYKALPQLTDPKRFASWLYAITRNRARRIGTQEASKATVSLSVIDEFIVSKSSELRDSLFEKTEQNIEHARILAEMAGLPEETSETMQLYYMQGWPVSRIASFFSIPPTTVKWRLHQGRIHLRKRLGENCTDQESPT